MKYPIHIHFRWNMALECRKQKTTVYMQQLLKLVSLNPILVFANVYIHGIYLYSSCASIKPQPYILFLHWHVFVCWLHKNMSLQCRCCTAKCNIWALSRNVFRSHSVDLPTWVCFPLCLDLLVASCWFLRACLADSYCRCRLHFACICCRMFAIIWDYFLWNLPYDKII